jgi:hypothetical protein
MEEYERLGTLKGCNEETLTRLAQSRLLWLM